MYIPAAFAEPDLAKLHDFMDANSFGLLVSQVEGALFASHLPLLLERPAILVGHMARANPQWQALAGQNALTIFSGPHTYISPTWYEAGPAVPTWNYTAVHAYGRAEVVEDETALLEIVQRTVRVYEQTMPRPWSFDPSSPFVERMLTQIVGFRIEIEKLEGKWKLNQNQPLERRQKVVRALEARDDDSARAVAAMMRAMLPGED